MNESSRQDRLRAKGSTFVGWVCVAGFIFCFIMLLRGSEFAIAGMVINPLLAMSSFLDARMHRRNAALSDWRDSVRSDT